MSNYYAGAGKVCIDPTEDMFPLPDPRPDRSGKPFVQSLVHDSCYCRSIALSDGENKALILSYDLVSVPPIDNFPEELSALTGIPAEHIYIVATHNHTAPFDRGGRPLNKIPEAKRWWYEKYESIEREAGLKVAMQAVNSMREATISYGETDSWINVNRDLKTPAACWVEGTNFGGDSDKTLSAVKITDKDGKLIAAMINHATHADCGFKMYDSDGLGKTSGNFPAYTCSFIEEKYASDGAIAMWCSGAAGDQNPYLMFGLQMEYPDGYSTLVEYPAGTGALQTEYIGRVHGADAARALQEAVPIEGECRLSFAVSYANIPQQKPIDPSVHGVRMGGFGPRPEGEVHIGPPAKLPEYVPDDESHAQMRFRGFSIGNLAILFANAELYSSFGTRIRKLMPNKHIITVTHESKSVGDVFDAAASDHKILQSFSRNIPGAADESVMQSAKEVLKELFTS